MKKSIELSYKEFEKTVKDISKNYSKNCQKDYQNILQKIAGIVEVKFSEDSQHFSITPRRKHIKRT